MLNARVLCCRKTQIANARIFQNKSPITQNGVGEELLLEAGVPGVSDDQGSEHGPDTSSGSSDALGGGSSADELGGGVNVLAGGGGGQKRL